MITSLLSALILGTARAADGADKISRTAYVAVCVGVVSVNLGNGIDHLPDFAAWMWVLCVLTMLPPHAMFSALHNGAPSRSDKFWQFLQVAAFWATVKVAPKMKNFNICYAMLYGAIRSLFIIPAVIWLNEPWLMLAMLQGVLMWVLGRMNQSRAVMVHWFIVAGFIGGMI